MNPSNKKPTALSPTDEKNVEMASASALQSKEVDRHTVTDESHCDQGPKLVNDKKNKKTKISLRDASGAAVRPGAIAVQGTGETTAPSEEPGQVLSDKKIQKTKISVRDTLDAVVRPGAVAVYGTGDALKRDKEFGQVSLLREPEIVMPALLGPSNAADRDQGYPNMNEKSHKVKKASTGSSLQSGAHAVQSVGVQVDIPSSGGGGDGTPVGAYNIVSSKAAIANRGGTVRPSNSPGVVSVEGSSPPQNERFGGVTSIGTYNVVSSKAATANRGGKFRPSNSPGTVSIEETASILTTEDTIANLNSGNRIQEARIETIESPEVSYTTLAVSGKSLGTVSEKSLGTLSKPESEEFLFLSSLPSHESEAFVLQEAKTSVFAAELVTDELLNDIERQDIVKQAQLAAQADVHQEMIAAAVAAEVVDKSEFEDMSGKKRWYVIVVLALIIVLAAVMGGVLGSRVNPAPPLPLASMAPSMSTFPSAAPSVTPNNDFCEEAIVVTSDDSVYAESLMNATIEIETRLSCSTGDEIPKRGQWYEYTGNGLRLTVSLLSASVDETQVEVFTGDSCGELVCAETGLVQTVDFPSRNPDLFEGSARSSTVIFPVNKNLTYHILVFSRLNATLGRTYRYNLKVADNSACRNAYPIDLLGESQTLHLGSTAAATVRDIPPPCGSATSSASPGVWYTVVGSGLNIEASTCSGAAFDTQISVYTGNCNNPTCVTGNDNSCGTQSSVLWLSSVGQTYYIFVHGASASATGSFELSVVERPGIDTCEGATTLDPLLGGQYSSVDSTTPSTVQGSTIGASFDDIPACGDLSNTASGVWYTVIGSGGRMRVFLDESGEGAGFNARVSVFQGNCNSLECVDRDDSLHWNSTAGELYFIYVYGVDGSAGNFGLFVDLGNAFCSDVANPIPSDFDYIEYTGTTAFGPDASIIESLPLCELSSFEGIVGRPAWYSVVGTGAKFRVASCLLANEIDFTVYSGDCENLLCVQEVDLGYDEYEGYGCISCVYDCEVRVSWESVAGEQYFIMVQGEGSHSIRVNED